jgi:hypothetical protein
MIGRFQITDLMNNGPRCMLLWLLFTGGSLPVVAEEPTSRASVKVAFTFQGAQYFHRWSKGDQHEFTPAKQEDLEKWADMVTINAYPSVQDGDGLAATANAVLENYQKHQAKVLRTDSVPRTADRPAEHLIVVVFGRPTFIEVAFARFKLLDGSGYSIVYSHRRYGEKIGDQKSVWLKDNGVETEKALMTWDSAPTPKSMRVTAR